MITDPETGERLAKVEGRQQDLATYLPALLNRFEHMERRMEQRLDRMDERIDARLDQMDERLDRMDERIDARLDRMDQRMDSFEQKLDSGLRSSQIGRIGIIIGLFSIAAAATLVAVQLAPQ